MHAGKYMGIMTTLKKPTAESFPLPGRRSQIPLLYIESRTLLGESTLGSSSRTNGM